MWGCFLMSGVKILHFLKDWWKSIPIHQNYTMALRIFWWWMIFFFMNVGDCTTAIVYLLHGGWGGGGGGVSVQLLLVLPGCAIDMRHIFSKFLPTYVHCNRCMYLQGLEKRGIGCKVMGPTMVLLTNLQPPAPGAHPYPIPGCYPTQALPHPSPIHPYEK